jgi:uncharacterized protein (DUF302 family)
MVRDDLVVRACAGDVSSATERCTAELERRGLRLMATFDHGAGAASVGLDLPSEVVLVFGDPAVGTKLMQLDPALGIELPLKLLLWEQDGATHVGFIDPATWSHRYAVPADHPVLTGMRHLLDQLADHVAASPS